MFKKSKRSFRQRVRRSDSDDDESSNANKLEEKHEQSTPDLKVSVVHENGDKNEKASTEDDGVSKLRTDAKTKLSFHHADDDEVEDVFVVKKSAYSRRMERNKKKILKSSFGVDQEKSSQDVVLENRNNNSFKTETVLDKTNEIIICPESEEEEDEESTGKSSKTNYVKAKSNNSIHQFRNAVERGTIPDAKVIYELKKHRQKMARTANEEFIPIGGGEEEESRSRLLREDDHDKSEDGDDDDDDGEDNDRIAFGEVDYRGKEREKVKERFRMVQEEREDRESGRSQRGPTESESDASDEEHHSSEASSHGDNRSESEDETDKWEREQIRKAMGVSGRVTHPEAEFNTRFLSDKCAVTNKMVNKLKEFADDHSVVPIDVDDQPESKSFGAHIPSYISERTSQSQSESTFDKITQKLANLKAKLEKEFEDQNNLYDRVCMDLKLTTQNLGLYESRLEEYTDDYKFYRSMQNFVRNLCECINDKLADLEKREQDALEVFQNSARKQLEILRNDTHDQNSMCIDLIGLTRNKEFSQYQHYKVNTIFEVYTFEGQEDRRNRVFKLEERFARQNRSLESGYCSDEETRSEESRNLDSMRTQLTKLFTDDDCTSVGAVIDQFAQWKNTRLFTYRESFIAEFLPKFLIYHVRHELALWNPFDHHSAIDLRQFDCIRKLIYYSTIVHSNADSNGSDGSELPDLNLLPTVIDTTILPKLITLIERQVWNPLSVRQTSRLASLLHSLITDCPILIDTSKQLPILLRNIVLRIEHTIENDIFIPQAIIPPEFFANQTTRSQYETVVVAFITRFFECQFWQALNLMHNIILLRSVIEDRVIKELSLEKICNRYLLLAIQRSSADPERTLAKVTSLVSGIPPEWRHQSDAVLNKVNGLLSQLIKDSSYPEEIKKKLSSLKS